MTDEAATIARGLTKAQREFLERVCAGRKPGLADREQDRARQSLRRMGLVKVVPNPRRWEPTALGLQVCALQSEQSA